MDNMSHGVPYVATASIAFPEDLIAKIEYAKSLNGFRMVIMQAPCPVGWRYDPAKTIEIGRAGVQSGIWPLYEIMDGEDFRLNYKPKELKPVTEYLRPQGRFRHMTEEEVADIQTYTSARWEMLEKADELKKRNATTTKANFFISEPPGNMVLRCGTGSR